MEASEFGKALRRQREQVRPEAVGLPVGSRRRAAGLRREEVAGLAGISVDYLTRLEQGRAVSPSAQIIEALARALRLADAERELLFTLAGLVAPGPGLICTRITASVQRLLDRLGNVPLVVYDAAWNLIVANAPYDALMGATSALKGNDRNGVWRNLVGPGSRAVQSSEEQDAAAARLVADLRLTAARYPKDPGLRRLLAELRSASPRFVELWSAASEPLPPDSSRHKVIRHPAVGDIALTCDTLVVASDDLRIMVYTAEPGSPDADLLELAIVLGTQELTAPPSASPSSAAM